MRMCTDSYCGLSIRLGSSRTSNTFVATLKSFFVSKDNIVKPLTKAAFALLAEQLGVGVAFDKDSLLRNRAMGRYFQEGSLAVIGLQRETIRDSHQRKGRTSPVVARNRQSLTR